MWRLLQINPLFFVEFLVFIIANKMGNFGFAFLVLQKVFFGLKYVHFFKIHRLYIDIFFSLEKYLNELKKLKERFL